MFRMLGGTAAALLLVSTAPAASAAVVTTTYNLPGNADAFGLMPLTLGHFSGAYRVTVRSSRAMASGVLASTAEEVHWHLNPTGGVPFGQVWIADNQTAIRSGAQSYSIDFLASPDTAETKCCWPVGQEMVSYHEEFHYTPLLYTDFGFAPGSDPITVTISVAPVPEPAAWAMMIIGFGLAGTALRRSRLGVNPA